MQGKAGAELAHNAGHYHAWCSYRSWWSHDNNSYRSSVTTVGRS